MNQQTVKLIVYGADQVCASCVGAPGSKDTFEWLQAAISRKYQEISIEYEYIDIHNPPNLEEHIDFTQRIIEEDLFYPVVLINNKVVGEGIPQLKKIYQALEAEGIISQY